MRYSRRDLLKIGATAGASLVLGRESLAAALRPQEAQLLKTIPKTGEKIPGVGWGSAATVSAASQNPAEHAALRDVLAAFTEVGGAVIDTSPSYRQSEEVIGQLLRDIGNADKIFMATKISGARGREAGMAQVDRSMTRLTPGDIDLNQVHNLGDWEVQLPLLRELKAEGRIRYIGITTSSDRQYDRLARILQSEDLDFVQFDYAIDNRNVEETILPIAKDRGLATLVNGPFGRTRLFRRVGDRPVPDYAREFGANSWAQFFLKWLLGHPDITVVIPATTDIEHLRDNMGAGVGRIPNEDERARMAAFIDGLPSG